MKAIEAFEAYCDAWAKHDHVALAELFTEDGVFEASTLDAPVKGQKDLKSQLRIISNSHSNIETETRIAIETEKGAYIEGTYKANIVGAGGKIDGSLLGRISVMWQPLKCRTGKFRVWLKYMIPARFMRKNVSVCLP